MTRSPPPPDARGAWLQARVSSEALQHVLGFLSMRDRAALLSTSSALAREPIATRFASYCGACDACATDKTPHLCRAKDNAQPAAFWTSLLSRSRGGALVELRLAGCAALSADVLASSPFTAAALENLQVLELTRCDAIGADGLRLLATTCRKLRELRLRDMSLDLAAFEALVAANAPSLRAVDLLGCHTLSGAHVRALAACGALEELSLRGCHAVDNASIALAAARLSRLRRLNLRYCHRVDDALVAQLARALPRLRALNLRYCYRLSDAAVGAICDALPALEALNLSQCARVTDAAIRRLAASLRHLRELRLWGCARLTSAAVAAISAGLPALSLVDLRGRDKLEAVIGGATALKFLLPTYRSTLAEWEQAGPPGVFKRLCAAAA